MIRCCCLRSLNPTFTIDVSFEATVRTDPDIGDLPCFLEEERIKQDEHEQFIFLVWDQATICLSSSALFVNVGFRRSRNKSPSRRQPTDVIKRLLY
mmetsp:Transcript_18527/g.33567  ORF Transcript_18527/g.33567 Transcript_18527/m.33567 type:complete len:96 (-) Transcript_18527:395-682(-)